METNGAVVLDLWEVIVEFIPGGKKEDVANKVVKIFADAGLETADFESIKGEDPHLDAAIDNFKSEGEDVDDYDYESDDYEDD